MTKPEQLSDLEMTRLCAEAAEVAGLIPTWDRKGLCTIGDEGEERPYKPLHDSAQAFDLIERFHLWPSYQQGWGVNWYWDGVGKPIKDIDTYDDDLKRAIVTCVALMQKAKTL